MLFVFVIGLMGINFYTFWDSVNKNVSQSTGIQPLLPKIFTLKDRQMEMLYMKYRFRWQWFVAVMIIALMLNTAVPVLGHASSPVSPPKIDRLTPVVLTPNLQEKYSEQVMTLKIKATITESGTVENNIQVITSSGDTAFDQAVIDSIRNSVFTPAHDDAGQAVVSSVILPLSVNVEKYVPEKPAATESGKEPAQ